MLRDYLVDLLTPDSSGPMQYALDRRTFWFSHYLYTGLRTSSGILLIALLALWLLSPLLAIATAFGAFAMALVDQVGPWHTKMREMVVSLLLNTGASLGVGLLTGSPWTQAVFTVVLAFASGFLLLYGKRGMPVQFAMLLAMTLSMVHVDERPDALWVSLSLGGGGLLYMVYALCVGWVQQPRLKQQVLAECLFELAHYFDIKRGFYERHVNLDQQFTKLIRKQVQLSEKQQGARDLVLQRRQGPDDARLIQIHLAMLDVYEQILSTHADYAALHRHFGQHEVLLFLRDLIDKAMRDIEAVAYAVTRDRPSESPVSYVAEQRAIEFDLHALTQQGIDPQALVLLRSTYYKILETATRIRALHLATRQRPEQLPPLNLGLFVSRPRIGLDMLRSNLSMESPIFRYALRTGMAVAVAQLLAQVLPYASHAYWIMLTIVIILKPTYSMTRKRRQQRLLGTAIGCVLAIGILQLVHKPLALLLVLYLSLMTSSTFMQIRYMYSSAAATVTVLVLLQLTTQGGGTQMVLERLTDTALGVLIATAFSHVFPNWERQSLPGQLRRLFGSARRYLEESRALLLHDLAQDQAYRLARKQFLDEIAGVNAALLRMLDEPRRRQQGVTEVNRLLVRIYLIASHVAGLRMLLRRHPDFQQSRAYQQLVDAALREAVHHLAMADQATGNTHANGAAEALAAPEATLPLTAETLPGSSPHTRAVLQERAAKLRTDAQELQHLSQLAQQALHRNHLVD